MEQRNNGREFTFSEAGTQSIQIDSDEHINIFQIDVSITNDTTISLAIGSQVVFSGAIIANASPLQLFFYDFGKGRGTGVKGDNLNITLGDAGKVYASYIIYK